jgi:hypothetical protein
LRDGVRADRLEHSDSKAVVEVQSADCAFPTLQQLFIIVIHKGDASGDRRTTAEGEVFAAAILTKLSSFSLASYARVPIRCRRKQLTVTLYYVTKNRKVIR